MKKSIVLEGRTLEYELSRKKVKNINLRVSAEGCVSVSAPRYVPLSAIESFLRRNAGRILSAADRQKSAPALSFNDGGSLPFMGRFLPLSIVPGSKNTLRCEDGRLLMELKDITDSALAEKIAMDFYRRRCEELMPDICRGIYPCFESRGIAFPALRYRRMKSCWGSCMPKKGAVTFNSLLAMTDRECMELVALHEFCHLIHPNHSQQFYALLSSLMPDWKDRRARLKSFAPYLR